MSTTTAKGSGNTKNNGGVVFGLNSQSVTSDSPMSSGVGPSEANTGNSYGSAVVANDGGDTKGFTDPMGVQKVKSGGTGGLAYSPARGERNFIVKAAGSEGAGKINNDASTVLTIPGSEFGFTGGKGRNALHPTVSTRKLGSDATETFNVLATPSSGVTPGFTKGTGEGDAQAFVMASGATPAADDAVAASRSVPGELTYHFGGLGKATTDEYKSRDAFEDATDTSS